MNRAKEAVLKRLSISDFGDNTQETAEENDAAGTNVAVAAAALTGIRDKTNLLANPLKTTLIIRSVQIVRRFES